jgi:lipid-A-disaccharide synthase-like uncharacterized protein
MSRIIISLAGNASYQLSSEAAKGIVQGNHISRGTEIMSVEQIWLAIGFLGQALFSMRFLVQWIASERRKESVIPIYFWYFSVGGGLTLLAYAIHRVDPVFMVGQAAGLFVYSRNLYLIHRKERQPVSA